MRISLSEELRLLEYSQRLGLRARAVLAQGERSVGRVLYEGAASGGAMAAGRQSGAIAVGNWADLVALDCSGPDLAASKGDMILDTFIFARDDRAVSEVWSAGRHIVTAGRHHAPRGGEQALWSDRCAAAWRAMISGWEGIRAEVLRRIRTREWPAGEMIPTEEQLAWNSAARGPRSTVPCVSWRKPV